jgi:signal peptidase II
LTLRRKTIFLNIAFAGAAADLFTKWAAFRYINEGGSVKIIKGFVELEPTRNPGAAFGMLKGHQTLFVIISVTAMLVIFGGILLLRHRSWLLTIAAGFIGGGVIGNFYDRVVLDGTVRDFLLLRVNELRWPTFNLADALICVGVALGLIYALRLKPVEIADEEVMVMEIPPPEGDADADDKQIAEVAQWRISPPESDP